MLNFLIIESMYSLQLILKAKKTLFPSNILSVTSPINFNSCLSEYKLNFITNVIAEIALQKNCSKTVSLCYKDLLQYGFITKLKLDFNGNFESLVDSYIHD